MSHLNIIDSVLHFSARYCDGKNKAIKHFPVDEEREQKENKTKEKIEETEKFLSRFNNNADGKYKLSDQDQFIWYTTMLNKHPYQKNDTQPPNAV